MQIETVLIVGAGTMGQQIGLQCAMSGFATIMYDISEDALDRCKTAQQNYVASWRNANPQVSDEEIAAGLERLSYSTDLETAAKNVDLVNESLPEILDIKQAVYQDLSRFCAPETILTTNTSTMLPSNMVPFIDQPSRFLALHFGNLVWESPIAEVMKHEGTDHEIFERTIAFAEKLSLVPIRIEKEQPGYVINSLIVPWMASALSLVVNGVASYQTVDKTWMLCAHMEPGPFGILDRMGYETAYNVCQLLIQADPNNPQHVKNLAYIKENFLDKGFLGVQTGQGHYSYPNPEYDEPDFLS